jgi:predicted Zn-dependent peptidase
LAEKYFQHSFSNGLTLIAEKMPGVQSAAMALLLTAGSAVDPPNQLGTAAILSDLVLRGAGNRDVRQLSDYLDSLGLHRSSSVGTYHARFGVEAVASRVIQSLSAYADIVRRPHLPQTGFDAARDLALQSLEGIQYGPRQKLIIKLREHFFPDPLGRNPMGKTQDLEKLTLADVKSHWQQQYQARHAILAIAGNIDFPQLQSEVQKYFGDFPAAKTSPINLHHVPPHHHHESQESEQTHIGLAYPSVPETDPDYYIIRLAMEVLGGGTSGRLFTEVREKRALCYSVWAGYTSLKGIGGILGYAGTSNERAQATLDCMLQEIHRLTSGLTQPELDRAKIGLKASLIMDGESSSARAGTIAHDFFIRGRMRDLDEIKSEIDRVSLDQVNHYLSTHLPGPFTIVTVGPKALKIPK